MIFILPGWFDASVSLTEDMQNQLREASEKVTDQLETLQWCDISTSFPSADDISDYVASDEESDVEDDKKVDDICYLQTPTQSDNSISSNEVDFDDMFLTF